MISEYSVQVVMRMPQYRTLPRLGTRLVGVLVTVLAVGAPPAAAQLAVRPVGGQVVGLVQEADGGGPVGYALVQVPASGIRVFSSPAGRFTLIGLPAGTHLLEVRQIGFAPVTVDLVVLPEVAGAPVTPLAIVLARQTLVLPEIVVTAQSCDDPRRMTHEGSAGIILDQLFTNALRLLAMEHEHPVHARFERLTAGLVALDSVQWFAWDTLTTRSEAIGRYERGRVLRTGSRGSIRYFTTSDVAQPEFREHHCLWVAGLEEVAGERLIRIDFEPARRVRTADWAGALYLDPVTAALRRSEARLVNIPRNAGGLRSTQCEVTYMELEPTLVHEQAANCYTRLSGGLTPVRQETWRLLDWEFPRGRPGGG